MADNLLTMQQVAERCYVSIDTVYRWIKRDGLPVIRKGRVVRIKPEDLDEFLSRAA